MARTDIADVRTRPHTLAARGELTDLIIDFQRAIGPDHHYLADWQQRATST
jgi:hypothetical protein